MSRIHRATRTTLYAIVVTLGALIVGRVVASPPAAGGGTGDPGALYAPHVADELLVKFKSQAGPSDRAAARAQLAAQKIHEFRSGAERWRLGQGQGVAQAIARLRGNPHVDYAEPNYLVKLQLASTDPRYPELWGMNNTGQTGGTPGADIDAERAWNVSTGSRDVLVAVIDTGFDYNHPDLAPNIWTNPGEIPANGIDDDHNGFIDDLHGWDFVNNDNDPFDDHGHGTHVSGTIGAVGDNGIGVAGVNWRVSIMGLKFLSASGSGSTADAVEAIEYGTMMGVDIMSNSWGGGGFSQTLLDAINGAAAAEVVFVAAAGNGGLDGIGDDNDVTPNYPSNYDAPNVIAVAATDHNDARAVFSNYGATTVDLGAPGVAVLSTLPGNSYGAFSGTSMATPHVSGAAALLRAVAPNTSAALVRQLLINFADDIPSMQGITVSGGRLNAFFPIAEPDDTPPGAIVDLAAAGATSNSLFLQWTAIGDDGLQGTASTYDVRYSTSPIDDGNFAAASKAAGAPAPQPSGAAESMEVLGLDPGTQYYFAAKAGDEWGNAGALGNVAVGMTLPPPTFASDPDTFQADLLTGQMATRTLTIQNAGVGTLDWRVPLPSVSGPVTVQHEPLELGKDEADPRPGIPAIEGFGGPDTFGYRWTDSDEPGGPTFSWTDIGMSGTPIAGLNGDDALSAPIPLGFNFSFYGNSFDAVRVSTNGWLSFTSTIATGSTAYGNQPLPNSAAPENLLAAFWDDLHFRGALRATYLAAGDSFIVQYTEVDRYATGSSLTFQAEVRPSGEIRFRYLNMAGVLDSATIGIQNANKTDGLTVVFNAGYVHDDLEIRIAAVPQWLTASPTSGRLFGGQAQDVTLTIDATGLDGGTYDGLVNVQTNDPLQPLVGHAVTLNVTGAPAIGVAPAALDFGQVFLGFSRTLDLKINNTGTDTLTVSSIVAGDPQVTLAPDMLSIPAHSGATVQVTFTPAGAGTLATTLDVTSDASNAPALSVPVAGSAAAAPIVLVDPASFSETLYTGGTVARNLRIHNTGGSDLVVNLSADLGSGLQPPPSESAGPPKGDESDAGSGDNRIDRSGGPDGFGYRFRDSDAPGGPVFNWVDISSLGTPINFGSFDDSNAGPIPIGFDFPFYGSTFNTVRACTNGWLSFTSTSTSTSNATLPTGGTTAPNNLLAVFWDDLHFRNVQRARYYNDGTRFIVQYTMVDRFTTGSNLTFQVLLYPSGRIVYQYLSMSGVLNSATIGIQNATRNVGLTVSSNENYVHNNLAIEIANIPTWLAVAPGSATIPPGGFQDFTVTFDAGASGDHVFQGAVRIATNIPDPALVSVPATLAVLGVADVDTVPASIAYGTRFVGYPHLKELSVRNVGTGDLTVTGVVSSDPSLFVEEPPSTGAVFVVPAGGVVLYNLRWLPAAPGPLDATITVSSDDPDEPTIVVPVTGNAILPPILGWSPSSFTDSLLAGETSQHMLHLANTGASDLEFEIGVRLNSGVVTPAASPELAKGEEPSSHGDPVIQKVGGPDMFGYAWKDSDAPGGPAFDWIDISSVGTPLAGLDGDDENAGPVSIGFNFPFYGTNFSAVRVCTNGWLSFSSTSTSFSNAALPTGGTSSPNNLLAAFWDDLHFFGVERARYYNDGTRFIVQYTDADRIGTTITEHYTFQIILYPDGRFRYQYLTMDGQLDSATIGIQNALRNDGLTVAHNALYMHDGLAIEFEAFPQWLGVGTAAGMIPPGGTLDIPVNFDARGVFGGLYSGGLTVMTNDPAHGVVDLPATLTVTGFPGISALPTTLDFGPVLFVGLTRDLPVQITNAGSDVLHVSGVSVTGDFSTDLSPFSLGVGQSRMLTVTFAPTGDGTRAGSLELTSDAVGTPVLGIPLAGLGLFPPIAGVDPASFEVALPPDGATQRTLRLHNTGASDLLWTVDVALGPPPAGAVAIDPGIEKPKGDESDNGTGFVAERVGGADKGGYFFRDSDEPGGPAFDWVDISGIGTPISFASYDDSNAGPIPIGFAFPFYGNTFNTVRACTNGWLSFTSTSTSLSNATLPTGGTSLPENLLAPFWDDLHFRGVQRARYYNDGTRFIVQYTMVDRYTSGSSLTFQVLLYPSGRIVYQYLSMSGVLDSATIGIQNATRDIGLTVASNAAYVHDGLAIAFDRIPRWLGAGPASGTIPAGGYADITLDVDADGLGDGDYDAVVRIDSNDPFHTPINVPVLLHVGQVDLTYIDLDPNTLNLAAQGQSVRAALQLPEAYDPHDIVLSSVSIDHQVYALPSPVSYEDTNLDGVLELVVRFDRAAFEAVVPEGDNVPVTVTGEVRDTTWFTGTDLIRTIHPQIGRPNGGEYLVTGTTERLSWSAPLLAAPRDYDVWLSRDGGATWEILATSVRNTYVDWVVSGPTTGTARLRVFAKDSRGVMGYDTSDAAFTIAGALFPPNVVDTLMLRLDADAVQMQWQRPAVDPAHGPAATYRVLRAFSPQGPWEEIGAVGVESFSDPVAAHGENALVLFKVVPANAAGGAE